jgi:hypothetical protein
MGGKHFVRLAVERLVPMIKSVWGEGMFNVNAIRQAYELQIGEQG